MLKRETILVLFISMMALVAAIGRPVVEYTGNGALRTITVSATGEAFADVDSVYFDIHISHNNLQPYQLSQALMDINAELQAIDSEAMDFQNTNTINLSDTNTNDDDRVYNLAPNYRITVYDLSQLGNVLDSLMALNINSIYSLSVKSDSTDFHKMEAEENALEQARMRAERLALETGSDVGQVVDIRLGYYQYGAYYGDNPAAWTSDSPSEITDLFNLHKMRFSVDVTITYELK